MKYAQISNPIVFSLSALMVLAYSLLLFLMVRRKEYLSGIAENMAIRFFLLCQSQLMLTPFTHWGTAFLVVPPQNMPIAYSQVLIWAYFILVFFPKIKNFWVNEFKFSFSKSFLTNPFIWMLPPLAALSCFWSDTPFVALKGGLILLAINIFSLYISTQFEWMDISSFFRWNITVIALLSLVIRRVSNVSATGDGGGLAGVLPAKNILGSLMVLGIILWMIHFFERKKNRVLSMFMILLCFSFLVQANSAGAYLTLIVLMAITLSGMLLKKFEFRSVAILTSLLFLLTILTSLFVGLNLESFLGFFGKDLTFTGRNEIWSVIIDAASQKPWTGYGAFSFWQPWRGAENPALDFWNFSDYWIPPSAHQGFLDVLLQLGFVGLVFVIFGLGLTLLQSMNFFFRQQGALALFPLTVVFHQLIANLAETFFIKPNIFWISFTMVAIKLSIYSHQGSILNVKTTRAEEVHPVSQLTYSSKDSSIR
jgi:O-antigen ligase